MKDVEARKQEAIAASEERARKVRKSRARRRTRKHKVRYNAKTE